MRAVTVMSQEKKNTSQAGHTAIDAGAEGGDAAAALAKRYPS